MQEIEVPLPSKTAATNGSKSTGKAESAKTESPKQVKKEIKPSVKRKAEEEVSEDEEFLPAPKTTRSTPKKAKAAEQPGKGEEPANKTPAKPASKPSQRTPKAAKKQDTKDVEDDAERKAILNSVETVALPDVEPPKGDTKYHPHMPI